MTFYLAMQDVETGEEHLHEQLERDAAIDMLKAHMRCFGTVRAHGTDAVIAFRHEIHAMEAARRGRRRQRVPS